ncbi:MAG: ROK family protein [Clostridiaceae bacterium]
MYNVGIDLGGTKTAAGLVNEAGEIICKETMPTRKGSSYSEIAEDMAGLALSVIRHSGLKIEQVRGIGIGCPGTADSEKGIILYSSTFGFVGSPLVKEVQKNIILPVFLDNDANCAALAESIAGAAIGSESSVAITLGTGIGGGIVIGGNVYRGFNYAGGEMGHMKIALDGEACSCGRKGCWETFASGTALISQTKKAAHANPESIINKLVKEDMGKIDGRTAFEAAREGDATGKMVVEKYIGYVSDGLINIINILMPQVVVIGGGVSNQGEYLLKPLRELVSAGVYGGKNIPQTEIRLAKLGNDAGIIGAASLGKK